MTPEELAHTIMTDLQERGFVVTGEPEYSARWNGWWIEVRGPGGYVFSILTQDGN